MYAELFTVWVSGCMRAFAFFVSVFFFMWQVLPGMKICLDID